MMELAAPAGSERTTTIGWEKAANPLLAAGDEDSFVRRLVGGLGSYPPYFLRLHETNRRGPGPDAPTLVGLDVAQVRRLLDDGAWAAAVGVTLEDSGDG